MKEIYFSYGGYFLLSKILVLALVCTIFSCSPKQKMDDLEKEVETRYIEVSDSKIVLEWIDSQLKSAEKSENFNQTIHLYQAKAKYYELLLKYDSAFFWHEKALMQAKNSGYIKLVPKIYEGLAYNTFMLFKKAESIKYAKLSLETAALMRDTMQMGFAHYYLWLSLEKEEAMFHLNQAVEMACYSQDKKLKAYVYDELGFVAWQNGNQMEGMKYFEEGLQLAEEIDDKDYVLLLHHNIAGVCDYFGKYHDAFAHYRKGIHLANKYKNKLFQARFYQKVAYNLCHYHNYQLGEAREYIEKAEKAYDGFYDPRLDCNIPAVKGTILYKEKKTKEALNQLKIAFNTALKSGENVELGRICSDISLVYLEEQNMDSATHYIQKSIAAFTEVRHKNGLQMSKLIQGKIFFNEQNDSQAKELILDVLKNIDIHNNRNYLHLELGYELLYKIYKNQGNYEQALSYYTQMNSIKDTIFSKDRAREIGKMQAEAELDKEIRDSQYKIQKLNRDIGVKNQRRNFILVILGLISIISVFLIYAVVSYRVNNRRLRILNTKVIRVNTNLERIVEKRTKQLKESHEKTIKVVHANSHDIRNHVARILGLIILYKNQLMETEFIMKNIEKSAEELDASVSEINIKLYESEKDF